MRGKNVCFWVLFSIHGVVQAAKEKVLGKHHVPAGVEVRGQALGSLLATKTPACVEPRLMNQSPPAAATALLFYANSMAEAESQLWTWACAEYNETRGSHFPRASLPTRGQRPAEIGSSCHPNLPPAKSRGAGFVEVVQSQPCPGSFLSWCIAAGTHGGPGQGPSVAEEAADLTCSFEGGRSLCWVKVKPPRFIGCQITKACQHLIISLVSY